MVDETIIGFDSNVLTGFLLANNGRLSEREGDLLAGERLATYRLFLYCAPYILPSVTVEAGRIPDGVKLEEHLRFIAYTFWQVILGHNQNQLVEQRAEELKQYHNGAVDCRLVAEAEIGEVPTLITLDSDSISRLSAHTRFDCGDPQSSGGTWLLRPELVPNGDPVWGTRSSSRVGGAGNFTYIVPSFSARAALDPPCHFLCLLCPLRSLGSLRPLCL